MSTQSTRSERLRSAFTSPTNGVLGLADALFASAWDHHIRADWQWGVCHIRWEQGSSEGPLDIPLRRSGFRAVLARVAVLCNQRQPGSVSPYGGTGELATSDPAAGFQVSFVNTASEQTLALARVSTDSPVAVPPVNGGTVSQALPRPVV